MPEGRSATKTPEPGGKASHRRRRNSRLGWDHLPENFGMGAHDGGMSPSLGFSS